MKIDMSPEQVQKANKFVNRMVGWGLLGGIVVLIVGANIAESNKLPEEKRAEACSNAIGAYVFAKEFVTDRLKAPASADFGDYHDSHVTGGNCKFTVSGYVDAQNSFGAKLRNYYVAKIRLDPADGSGHLEYIDMGSSPPQPPPTVDAPPSAPATPYKPVDPAKLGKYCIDVKSGARVLCAE